MGKPLQSLAELLPSMPQREVGGRISSDRFDYQKDWTLTKLLELHTTSGDYVVLCEFHEDVTVLDCANDPKSAVFYQIKTDNSNNWTIKRLTYRKKERGKVGRHASIMGKLCGKAPELSDAAAHFRFVSNAAFSLRLDPSYVGDPPVVLLGSMLHPEDLEEFVGALKDELGAEVATIIKSVVGFEIAALPLNEHSSTVKGKLAEFLEQYANGCSVPVPTLYRSLVDEIRRRTVADSPVATLPEICRRKGIGRFDLDRMLQAAIKSTPADRVWLSIEQRLTAEKIPLETHRMLSQAFSPYYVRRLSPVDSPFQKLRRLLNEASQHLLAENPSIELYELAVRSLDQVRSSGALAASQMTDNQAHVMVMMELYEGRDGEVPQIGEQSAQGQS